MRITIKGFITHKDKENYSDCADRYAINIENNRFAIADGVSKSFYPDLWATILVEKFVALKNDEELSIEECQSEWLKEVTEKATSPTAKFFTKNAFARQESGLATFVTLHFTEKKWIASVLGDSFLFFAPKVNSGFDDWIKLSSKSEPIVFDSFPDYYSSRNKQHGETQKEEHDISEGTFYLMTDALSEWVFNKKEKAIQEISEKWINQEEFERSIAELRSLNELNDDDSAILIIEVKDDQKAELTYSETNIQSLSELVNTEKSKTDKQQTDNKVEDFLNTARETVTSESEEDVSKEDAPLDSTENFDSEATVQEVDNENKEKKESSEDSEKILSNDAEKIFIEIMKIYNKAIIDIQNKIKNEQKNLSDEELTLLIEKTRKIWHFPQEQK